MRNPFVLGVGGVVSADIAVPEHEREVSFYSQVLTTGATPLWREDLMNNHGMPVIGLGARVPEYEMLPLHWMPHFQVADVAASAARALELGGKELMHGRDEAGQSLWAGVMDPSGVGFGIIPAVGDEVTLPDPSEAYGRIAGLSLLAADPAAASDYYAQVIGWSATAGARDGEFEMRRPDGDAVAVIAPEGGDRAGVPSVWMLSLPVGDMAESLRRAESGGGEVVWRTSGDGAAVVRDPVGVHFALESSA